MQSDSDDDDWPPGGPKHAEIFSLPTRMRHSAPREYGPSPVYKRGQRVEFWEEEEVFLGKLIEGHWISGTIISVYDFDPETPQYHGQIEVMCDLVKNPRPYEERRYETIFPPFHNVRVLPDPWVYGPECSRSTTGCARAGAWHSNERNQYFI